MNKCFEHIRPVRSGFMPAHAAVHGVAKATIDQLEGLFGLRHENGDGLTYNLTYFISTPRGLAVVRDHWNNPENTYSLLSEDRRAVTWLRAYFRKHGLQTLSLGFTEVHNGN